MKFLKDFTPELTIASPGRINIIGEHTDYNLGYVLPTAIEKKITFEFQKNNTDAQCYVYSKGFDTGFEINLNQLNKSSIEWENYILGVLFEISKKSHKLAGFNCVIESNLPSGSGLSSSAALECGLAFGLNELFNLNLSKSEIVKLSQRAEHTFVGTECGIMDQFASVMSKEGHVILLDCKSLESKQIPINLNPYKLILLNTKVSHNLATSEYNMRKKECEIGVAAINKKYPEVKSLRDVNEAMLVSVKGKITNTVFNRCSFIIQENNRVLEATNALKTNNLKLLGQLLYEAHEGLRSLYEVSCPESDFLVDFSKKYKGVLGARQTGGGFGGCTLNIIHGDEIDAFIASASQAYKEAFDINLETFEVRPSVGTSIEHVKM